MEQATCKNCNAVLIDAYCHKCGQKASTSRITLKSLWHDIVHSLTHIEKGFLYTTIGLFIYPGKVINGYFSGKRKNFHKPFGLWFIWVAVFLFVNSILAKESHHVSLTDIDPNDPLYEAIKFVFPYYDHYMAFITLPLFVIGPLITYPLITRRLNYNYAETLIIGVYLSATGYIIAIIVNTIGAISGTYSYIANNQIEVLIPQFFLLWAFFDVIKRRPYWQSIILSLFANILSIIIFWGYLRYAIPFIVSLFM